MIDSASNVNLIRADQHVKLGSPRLSLDKIHFDGVGSSNNLTLGGFQTEIIVDGGHSYSICVHVVSNSMLRHKLLIGTSFLNMTNVNFKSVEKVTISPLSEATVYKRRMQR